MGSISIMNDNRKIWTWNAAFPKAHETCIHELIANRVSEQPSAPAVCAWDGDWSYRDLDKLSTCLARQLLDLGVGSTSIIPLCFEKSKYYPIAVLAVMKAGGASVALDASQPQERLRSIVSQVNPTVVLSSLSNQELAKSLGISQTVVTVNDVALSQMMKNSENRKLPVVNPSNRLYVVFTSGSTGTPKGVIITHSNYSSAIHYQQEAHGFKSTSRVYDFASYAFDVSWSNILHTLVVGACLCIPSDEDRRDNLAESIDRFGATHVDVTPSVARVIPDSTLRKVDTLVLGGEKLPLEDARRWSSLVDLKNPYGPSECTPTATIATIKPDGNFQGEIGKGLGLNTWVVDVDDRDTLVSIGNIGELLLEGPLVGAGYLNDPEKSAAAFIENPKFLLLGGDGPDQPGRPGRLYKTGDLVYYNRDGSLTFVGRKDTQVKINGQRVELSDVESHVLKHIPNTTVRSIAAETIVPKTSSSAVLVVFMEISLPRSGAHGQDHLLTYTKGIISGLSEKLRTEIPSYMIPAVYIPLEAFPLSQTGKTDRRALRAIGEAMDLTELAALNAFHTERRPPNTGMETQLQRLWCEVLEIDETSIGLDDNFLQNGGDSLAAMRLVRLAREHRLSLTVAGIFTHPRLEDMANIAGILDEKSSLTIQAFELLGDVDIEKLRSETAQLCAVDVAQVEDVLPCTPLQEGLMSLSTKEDGAYIVQYALELRDDVDLQHLSQSWNAVVSSSPILRTRLVAAGDRGLLQVQVKEHLPLFKGLDNELRTLDQVKTDIKRVTLGSPLAKFELVRESHHANKHYFIWTMHHAVYDGWSIDLMLEKLEGAYHGSETQHSHSHLRNFIKHIYELDNTQLSRYWADQFRGSEAQIFPSLPSPNYQPVSDNFFNHAVSGLQWPTSGITASSAIRAALSVLLAAYTNAPDAIFGVTTTGRQAAVSGIEEMIAPTIATMPVRVSVNREQSLNSFLQQVQSQTVEMTTFEQAGLQNIQRISPDAEQACRFQTLLVVHPFTKSDIVDSFIFANSIEDLNRGDVEGLAGLGTYAFTLDCHLEERGADLRVSFDPAVVEYHQVDRLVRQFEHILRQICSDGQVEKTVAEIETVSDDDLRDIWAWNASVPDTVNTCVHDLIRETALRQPQVPAISAWDGDWTYAELDDLSTRLAHSLGSLGVADTIVPLCFEKSKWTPVAMLAVMKAGAASVMMDTSQPLDRLRSIVSQVRPRVILSSPSKEALTMNLSQAFRVIVDLSLMESLPSAPGYLPIVDPDSTLYLVFTSGSTGTPKGVTITHANYSSAIYYQQEAHGFRPTSRVYDFASYAFDVSWSNFLHTLTVGACLCIPSDIDRQDDLAGSLERFHATHADITPSAASILPNKSFERLHTVVLGGEKLSAKQAEHWSKLVNLKNPYGPSECTPTATIMTITPNDEFKGSIGKGLGLTTWVVDTAGESSLAPIGSVGELWLEGPLVGAGYYGDKEKTMTAFVEDPKFLLKGGPENPGRRGRLYKTGDLVRYNPDGSLSFIGRKDAQVKINGQRVELSEIESHIARYEDIHQAVVLLPKSGFCSNKLICLFSIKGLAQTHRSSEKIRLIDDSNATTISKHVEALQSILHGILPTYMVPSGWVALERLPLSTSGKLDSKSLLNWLVNMNRETFTNAFPSSEDGAALRAPRTDMERVIAAACSYILNLPVSDINLDRSFIANGGDSISAMRLSAHCRTSNVAISVGHLLKSKTLAEFATSSDVVTVSKSLIVEDEVEKPFELSPIQMWFFEQATYDKSASNYCNQGFYLKIKRHLQPELIAKAISQIVKQHSMLRNRFQKHDDRWVQKFVELNEGAYHFGSCQMETVADVEHLAVLRHQSLDIETGPIFSADLCELDSGEQFLVLISHHLVIDLVSWRVILDDLEHLLNGVELQPSMSFQTWNKMQIQHGKNDPKFSPEKVLSTNRVGNDLSFWHFTSLTPNSVEDHIQHSATADKETTGIMLKEANSAFNTEPVELLLSAVWHAFFRVFPHREGLTIFSEGHGREPWSPEIDLSRTVGWFTTISPIHLAQDSMSSSTANLVRFIKDARRKLPANGWAYFVSRYLNESGRAAFEGHSSTMEVTFNYHGQFQQLERKDALFENVLLKGVCEQGPSLPASSLVSVEVSIEDGQALFDVSVNRHIAHQKLIAIWVSEISQSLETICHELVASKSSSHTLVDFEFLGLDYEGLDKLQDSIIPEIESANQSKIENIYPCLPTVDGILISQAKDSESYKTLQQFEITSQAFTPILLDELAQAWQKLVDQQPALRTIFIPGLDKSAAFNQVVLEKHGADIILLHSESSSEIEGFESLRNLPLVDYQKLLPPHRIAFCQVNPNRVICQLEMSHAITDGASMPIITQGLAKAYRSDSTLTNRLNIAERSMHAELRAASSGKIDYWKGKLDGVEPCHFPKIADTPAKAGTNATAVCEIDGQLFHMIQEYCRSESVTVASFLQAVWALTLMTYTGTSAACFGYLASGRDLPITGLDKLIGAYTNMLVCRVDIDRDASSGDLIRGVYEETIRDLDYQHCSLASIQHELGISSGESLFNSIVSYQRQDEELLGEIEGLTIKTRNGADPTEVSLRIVSVGYVRCELADNYQYDIVVNITHGVTFIEIVFDYDCAYFSKTQADRVLSLVKTISATLCDNSSLSRLNMTCSEDLSDIWKWNTTTAETIDHCVHELIAETTKKQPGATAICAWDGEWTYAELDELSTQLARHLVSLGVGADVVVPLCFEKSKWTPVAMMAVMKAGGASVAMDSNQPEERLRTIVNQVKAPVMLSSSANESLAGRLTSDITEPTPLVIVDDASFVTLSSHGNLPALPIVTPNNRLYVVFTSGSTGVPKGVVVTHSNLTSAIKHQRERLGFTTDTRVFDFSSYMFDVVWCNLLQGLSAGSCVCIPSDHDKKTDFMGAMTRLRANLVILTPSAIRGVNVDALNSLRHLHFIGEPLHINTFKKVDETVNVSNLYGPTECTTFSTVQAIQGRHSQAITIGNGAGLNTWVVDTATGTSLVPIGSTGELLLEGPLVAAGYLNDPVKTSAAFIEDPAFLVDGILGHPGRRGRLYKTGDVVRQNSDGTLTFIGRKDAQIKINGQRVELGDIESHVQSALVENHEGVQVVAEVVSPQESSNSMLVAFVCFASSNTDDISDSELLEFTRKATAPLDGRLATQVPVYMIPTAYIPLRNIPATATGKTDRRRLSEMAKALTWDQLTSTNTSKSDRRTPSTQLEIQLQTLWADVLGVQKDLLGADDSFLRVGGDSVGAIRLVGSARECGYSLSVADILKSPRLSDMAKLMVEVKSSQNEEIAPFSLLHPNADVDACLKETAELCAVEPQQIQDLYPCTPLQEGLLALTAKRPGDYITRCVLELQGTVQTNKFQQAWENVLEKLSILRTRIVDLAKEGLMQVVIDQPPQWISSGNAILDEYVRVDEERTTGLGTSLVRYGLVTDSGKNFFVLTLHHAVYDGLALNLMFEILEKAYRGQLISDLPDFKQFVRHVSGINFQDAEAFWSDQLKASEAQIFPSLPSSTSQPRTDKSLTHKIENLSWPKTDITASTIVRAALSILLADYTDAEDVIFGATSTGRQIPIPGVERMVGPTIATMPVRVSIDQDESIQKLLSQIQEQSINLAAFEQLGLQRIRKLGADAARACDFQTLLVVQPADESAEWRSDIIVRDVNEDAQDNNGIQESETYALTLECHLGVDKLRIKVNFDSGVIGEVQVKRLAQQWEHILRQICASDHEQKVSDIIATSTEDVIDIWNWNAVVPETINKCVHELITETARRQPHSQAVCAWDGSWTYGELHDLSTRLAHYLISLGVTSQHIIPLLFEKSKWMPITMLGVMKAGAASVAVDTNQPEERLRSIISQAYPVLTLSSKSKGDLARSLTPAQNIVVNEESMAALPGVFPGQQLPMVDPTSRLYLVFTSGSTGTPKGVIIRHVNFASAIKYQKEAQGILPTSRVYDFASYAFDVAWANPLLTFEIGACLCIPSDADRKDDLNGSIARLMPTHADLTPSAALVLSQKSLQQLHTLTLGGERLSADQAEKWSQFVTVKNSYGPSECTPTATFTDAIGPDCPLGASIGKPHGLITWVADAATGQTLVPIGSVGELLLEGPLVGAGYLGDDVKTANAFIEDPAFLVRGGSVGQSGRHGRLYKTGDLVRYNCDGSVAFVGRKDAQVKINGQRVELGEIENHIARYPAVRQVAALLATVGNCAKKLVGIISFDGVRDVANVVGEANISIISSSHNKLVNNHIQALQLLLHDTLPQYMVPSLWIILNDFPMTASGKQNNKALQDFLHTMDKNTLTKLLSIEQDVAVREPTSDMERLICKACGVILNIPSTSVRLDQSFIANGGDSISAMRLASQCRANNVAFSVASLLQSKSLADFAASSAVAAAVTVKQEEQWNVPFQLSPIQQWFFDQSPFRGDDPREQFYNQGFYVKVKRSIEVEKVERAIAKLVDHHAMLRSRFHQLDGNWTQLVLPPAQDHFHFRVSSHHSMEEIHILAQEQHRSLDIENGPVFSANVCQLGEHKYLILIAHHLVVDLVSWRIILDDLETLFTGAKLEAGIPFQAWNKLQIEKSTSITFQPENSLSTVGIQNNLDFWNYSAATPNSLGDHELRFIDIDQETTSLVLGRVNHVMNTKPVEIFLSAIWHAFFHVFSQRDALTIFSEGHGRESWDDSVDLSKTVGWFTTLSPINIARGEAATPRTIARMVKDARRKLPANGWSYFASRYLNLEGQKMFQGHNVDTEVVFNYHGQFQQLETKDALFEDIILQGVSEQGLAIPASTLFNIEIAIEEGQAHFDFSFNRHIAHQDLIQQWIDHISPSLKYVCSELLASSVSHTLCDFEFVKLDYNRLDELEQHIFPSLQAGNGSVVENIYPCSPTVDGMLLSQVKQPDSYKTLQLYKISSPRTKSLSLELLVQAWQRVVAHQPALRTVFIDGLDKTAAFNQALLKQYTGESITLRAESEADAHRKLKQLPPVNYHQQKPPHRIAFCQIGDDSVLCQIEMSHAITDGASTSILTHDLSNAYLQELAPTNLVQTTEGFTRALLSTPYEKKVKFWADKLAGIEPCHFPYLSGLHHEAGASTSEISMIFDDGVFGPIQQFCSTHQVTPASLLKSAWAITLSAYVGTNSVCFGYLASGRDVPVEGLEKSVGAYTNMMVCYANVDVKTAESDFVQDMHKQLMQDLSFQHVSLASIQHSLGLSSGRQLFNSIVSFQRVNESANEDSTDTLVFETIDGQDPTEVS